MFKHFQPEGLQVCGVVRQLRFAFARDITLTLPSRSEICSVSRDHLHKDTVVFTYVEDGEGEKNFNFRIIAPNDGLESNIYHKFIGNIVNEFEYPLSVFQILTIKELRAFTPTEFEHFTGNNPIHRQQIYDLRYAFVD
jgi:hypothetical protein